MFTQESNTQTINKIVQQLVSSTQKEKYVLIDGDRTLSPVDATRSFLEHSSIDEAMLEACFELSHYSFEMFLNAAKLYSTVAPKDYLQYCNQAAQEVEEASRHDDRERRETRQEEVASRWKATPVEERQK